MEARRTRQEMYLIGAGLEKQYDWGDLTWGGSCFVYDDEIYAPFRTGTPGQALFRQPDGLTYVGDVRITEVSIVDFDSALERLRVGFDGIGRLGSLRFSDA